MSNTSPSSNTFVSCVFPRQRNGLVFCYLPTDIQSLLRKIRADHPCFQKNLNDYYPRFIFHRSVFIDRFDKAIDEIDFSIEKHERKVKKILDPDHYSPCEYLRKIENQYIWKKSTIPFLSEQLSVAKHIKEALVGVVEPFTTQALWDFFQPYFFQ